MLQKAKSACDAVVVRYTLLTPREKFKFYLNAIADGFLTIFLFLMIWVGVTKDFNAFYFWIPLLLFAVVIRAKQMGKRLGI